MQYIIQALAGVAGIALGAAVLKYRWYRQDRAFWRGPRRSTATCEQRRGSNG